MEACWRLPSACWRRQPRGATIFFWSRALHSSIRRRDFIAGSAAALTLAGCSRQRPLQPSAVSIVRAPRYDQTLYATVRGLLDRHQLNVRGKRVVLKPNLVEFDPHTAINTNPVVVHAALEAFRKLGAAEVRIAEGPGHRRATLDFAEAAGYFSTVPKFEDIFTDLNLDSVAKRDIPQPVSQLKSLY